MAFTNKLFQRDLKHIQLRILFFLTYHFYQLFIKFGKNPVDFLSSKSKLINNTELIINNMAKLF